MARSYGDRCGIARALDVVGERWALLLVRELVLGPKRFTDLQQGLPRVGPDMLAQRLRDLEAAGIVARTTLPPPAASRVYSLTPRGHDLEPVLHALGRFGSRQPMPDGAGAPPVFGPDAVVVALPTLFDPVRAGDFAATVGLVVGSDRVVVTVSEGVLTVARGEPDDADVVIDALPETLAALLWHGRPLVDALTAGDAVVSGRRRTAERFLRLFPLPASAA